VSSGQSKAGLTVGPVHATSVLMILGLAAAAINAGLVIWFSASVGGFYLTSTGKLYLFIIAGTVALSLAVKLVGWRWASAFLAMLQFAPLIWCVGVVVSLLARI
jgi:hypothetical protein